MTRKVVLALLGILILGGVGLGCNESSSGKTETTPKASASADAKETTENDTKKADTPATNNGLVGLTKPNPTATDVSDKDRLAAWPCSTPGPERDKWVWVAVQLTGIHGPVVARACDSQLVAIPSSQLKDSGWNSDIVLPNGVSGSFSKVPGVPFESRLPNGGAYMSVADVFDKKVKPSLQVRVGAQWVSSTQFTLVHTEGLAAPQGAADYSCGSLLQLTVTEQTPAWVTQARAKCLGMGYGHHHHQVVVPPVPPEPPPPEPAAPAPKPAPAASTRVKVELPPVPAIETRSDPVVPIIK